MVVNSDILPVMEMRFAERSDIQSIVELLRISRTGLGIPKSERYWEWKHLENPFGQSPVLLAFEDSRLIGVRAFMKWSWTDGDRTFNALRAVDTATHPDKRREGVFQKLTLTLTERSEKDGVDFIFNTPNNFSLPGYLKMGWKKAYRIPVRLKLFPFMGKIDMQTVEQFEISKVRFPDHIIRRQQYAGMCYPENYLRWRYLENPACEYFGFGNSGSDFKYLCIFRIKEHSWFNELRICELITQKTALSKNFGKQLKEAARTFGCRVVSCGAYSDPLTKEILNRNGFMRPAAVGLQMTVRDLNVEAMDFFEQKKRLDLPLGLFEFF